jgi:hypothetical protein
VEQKKSTWAEKKLETIPSLLRCLRYDIRHDLKTKEELDQDIQDILEFIYRIDPSDES